MKASSCRFHSTLFAATLIQVTPAHFRISSSHLSFGRACFLFPSNGIHSVTVFVHLLSGSLAICPAHCHLSLLVTNLISRRPVCSLTYLFVLRSLLVTPIIALSIALCVACILLCIFLFNAQVWLPYVIAG